MLWSIAKFARTTRVVWLVFLCVSVMACAARDPRAVAARLDLDGKTGVYSWLVEHDPSSLDVAGSAVAPLHALVPDGTIRAVPKNLRAACAAARRDHALLLIFVSSSEAERRDSALDCGVATYRDGAALVIAPR